LIEINTRRCSLRYRISTYEYEIAWATGRAVHGHGDASMKNWPDYIKERTAQLRNLRSGAPDVMKAFSGMALAALAPKALDGKTKELIALGIAVAIHCDDCVGFHVKAALEQGASRDEVMEALGMAIYMGAGPSVMYANHALEAFEQFKTAATKPVLAPA
jgi:AhpD family alkylhydroperoxidase